MANLKAKGWKLKELRKHEMEIIGVRYDESIMNEQSRNENSRRKVSIDGNFR